MAIGRPLHKDVVSTALAVLLAVPAAVLIPAVCRAGAEPVRLPGEECSAGGRGGSCSGSIKGNMARSNDISAKKELLLIQLSRSGLLRTHQHRTSSPQDVHADLHLQKGHGSDATMGTDTSAVAADNAGCHDATDGERCYGAVRWAMDHGIELNPDWYPNLSESSSFAEFQLRLHHLREGECEIPCTSPVPGTSSPQDVHADLRREQVHGSDTTMGADTSAAAADNAECHDAVSGERCYGAVRWAKDHGIKQHPEWYPDLSEDSTFAEFQLQLHREGEADCPPPCASPPPGTTPTPLIGTTVAETTGVPLTTTRESGKAPGARLSSVRHCYLAPLQPGAGCELLDALSGPRFDLNRFGQETSGKRRCLKRMRGAGGNAFVFAVGRCELWLCPSRTALRASAGPVSAATVAPSLRAYNGKYVGANENGGIDANRDSVGVQTALDIVRNADGTVALKTAFGNFISAESSGRVVADRPAIDDWEKFHLISASDGRVSFKSYHDTFLGADSDGIIVADSLARGESEMFDIVNGTTAEPGQPSRSMPSDASVYSDLCDFQEQSGGRHGQERRSPVFVKLWEWNFADVARECEDFLGPNGFDAVQLSPVVEHKLGSAWWTKYQPVSFGLNSRSGSAKEFKDMVARCRAVGVQVIVDAVLNHVATPCKKARKAGSAPVMPCKGWAGSRYGNRRVAGARGWDAAGPELFHHRRGKPLKRNCSVSPTTGWLCPDNDCTPCDMYGLPDWNTELPEVRNMQVKHLRELHNIGVTMLRIDAALYHTVDDLAAILNTLPWDYVYQEWWGEFPEADRTKFVGHHRDLEYVEKIREALSVDDISSFREALQITSGVVGVDPEKAVYPITYHDGRSEGADPEKTTYKNGMEYHQQQKFLLAWPAGISVLLWGGYGWEDMEQGPPGCEKGDKRCSPLPVFDASTGEPRCMPTPTESPLPSGKASERGWVCEHRWAGVAGLVGFRKACRGLPVTQTWVPGQQPDIEAGRLAFRIGEECFVALSRGHNTKTPASWERPGDWALTLTTGLPKGRYCDLASLPTRQGWDGKHCPREVTLGEGGAVIEGTVPEGDLLAIHVGTRRDD